MRSPLAVAVVAGFLAATGHPDDLPAQQARTDGGLFPFILPWDDASESITNVKSWPGDDSASIEAVYLRDGHLHSGSKRVRFLGVNLCFGACFPEHEASERVAARMAKFGINCVRFHHMDTSASPRGLLRSDRLTIDPVQLEKLDYLIAQLKKQGIYSNLNLHVGRRYPNRPEWEGMPSYFKGVDNFDPEMIRMQMQYARELLHHQNPYTGTRYAEEPAVAIVEINNENALWQDWWGGRLDEMPAVYADTLEKAWSSFLGEVYGGSDARLKQAWNVRADPIGGELLKNAVFAQGVQNWNLEQHEGAKASAEAVRTARGSHLRITVSSPGPQGWHVQLSQPGLPLVRDRAYTLKFRARSDAAREIQVNAMQAHEPWRQFWNSAVRLTNEWQTFSQVFSIPEEDNNGRITFSNLGETAGTIEISDVSLKPGGVLGLRDGEALGRIQWFRKADFASRTQEAQRDWVRFLWSVEERYWAGMSRFLKNDLGVKAVVIGTQMGWSPPLVQAQLDAIDSHSYWQHPHFPRRPWDSEDWFINNIPMTDSENGGTLSRLGLSRVVGKPFFCTEYNHSAPNTYGSEGFLLLAAYAARQDWDGIFAFAYSHRDGDWDAGKITSFFDIDQHPTKMATLPTAAAIFRRGDVPRAAQSVIATPTPLEWYEAGRTQGSWGLGASAFGVPEAAALRAFVGVALDAKAALRAPLGETSESDAAAFSWHSRGMGGGGYVTIDTPRTVGLIGSTKAGSYKFALASIEPGANRQDWATITLTAIDGADLRSPGRVLLTTTGEATNKGMAWKDERRTSVGRNWGESPSLVEGIAANIELTGVPAGRVKAWALDEKGQRRGPADVSPARSGTARIKVGPEHQTLWYEIEIGP